MNIIPIQDVWFDDTAISAMGRAFELTCKSLQIIGDAVSVRELIAMRIIEAAKDGERDPARLYEQTLIIFGMIDNRWIISVGPKPPAPAYALVTHAA